MNIKRLAPFVLALNPMAGAVQSGSCPSFVAVEEAVFTPVVGDSDFGASIAVSGAWAAVAGRMAGTGPTTGQAKFILYNRGPQGSWTKQTTGTSGMTVDLDGDKVILAQSWTLANALAFERSGPAWNQSQVINYAGCPHDDFGRGLALQGDVAAIGAADESYGVGWVIVYDWNGSSWVERYTMLNGAFDSIGRRVAIDGRWVVAGGEHSAYIHELSPTTWSSQFVQPATTVTTDGFGEAVAVSGDTVAISAPFMDGAAGLVTGRVFLFDYDGVQWRRGQELESSLSEHGERFGMSLAMHGDRLLVGATGTTNPSGAGGGAVYVFDRIGGIWVEQGRFFRSSATGGGDFGTSVDFDGDAVVVGATGAGFAFRLVDVQAPTAYCTAGTTASGCAASLSGSGTPSASAPSGFVVQASNLEGQKDGTIYFGTAGAQANPWGSGTSYQCVVPPVTRTGVQQGVGTVGACDGVYSFDLNAWMSAHPAKRPPAGSTVWTQAWFRDPGNGSNQSTSLSDGLSFTLCP